MKDKRDYEKLFTEEYKKHKDDIAELFRWPAFTNIALLSEIAIAYERALHYSDDPEKFMIWEQRYNELIKVALSRMEK